jgi:diketogulonate reductase-like aldo/keto reductase
MLDCASRYKNEELVGEALTHCLNVDKSVTREEMFVVSKVWWDDVEDVEGACRRSMQKLGVEYLDLYLVHWPIALKQVGEGQYQRIMMPMYKIWEQMESLVDKGLVKTIGVSNFGVQLMWDMLSYARILPACNEIELHPMNA